MASSVSNVPSGVGGSTYYGAMGGPTGRARSGLPFGHETMARHPGNLHWPLEPIVWDGGASFDKGALTISRLKERQELEAVADKNPLSLEEISDELSQLKGMVARQDTWTRGLLIALLPAIEKSLGAHQRRGTSVIAHLSLLEELKRALSS